jgi:hypothetical protein
MITVIEYIFVVVRVSQSLFCAMFCGSLIVFLSFFWQLYCLYFFMYGFWLPLLYIQSVLSMRVNEILDQKIFVETVKLYTVII